MTLHVAVDGAPLSVTWAGVARYVAGVSAAAAAHDPSLDISILMYARRRRSGVVTHAVSLSPRVQIVEMSLARSRTMSALARLAVPVPMHSLTSADVVLVTRYWGVGGSRPTVACVYDTVWRRAPWTVEAGYRPRLTKLAERTIKDATSLVVMSEAVRNELADIDASAPARAFVVPPARAALPPMADAEVELLLRDCNVGRPFVLFVGTIEPRKNLDRLLDAWPGVSAELGGATLVVAGRRGWAATSTIGRLEAAPTVRWLSPTDRLLAALYRRADALVLPSIYEGYGLPIAEASDVGLPIACSDIAVFREVAGSASPEFFDPIDVDEMATAVICAARKNRMNSSPVDDVGSGEALAGALHAASRG